MEIAQGCRRTEAVWAAHGALRKLLVGDGMTCHKLMLPGSSSWGDWQVSLLQLLVLLPGICSTLVQVYCALGPVRRCEAILLTIHLRVSLVDGEHDLRLGRSCLDAVGANVTLSPERILLTFLHLFDVLDQLLLRHLFECWLASGLLGRLVKLLAFSRVLFFE